MVKKNINFWTNYKDLNNLELKGIESLKFARKLILDNIPIKQIVSIYVKGSFIRREMNEKSDVDTVTIVKNSKYLTKVKDLEKKYRFNFDPIIQFSAYSLWELKNNKHSKSGKTSRASPSRFVVLLDHYECLYGKELDKRSFNQGPAKRHLKGMIYAFRHIFIPAYARREFSFNEIVKQTFWLVENEQVWRGGNAPHNWSELAKGIRNKDHIIHAALTLRHNPKKDDITKRLYFQKLENYLSSLEKLIKS